MIFSLPENSRRPEIILCCGNSRCSKAFSKSQRRKSSSPMEKYNKSTNSFEMVDTFKAL